MRMLSLLVCSLALSVSAGAQVPLQVAGLPDDAPMTVAARLLPGLLVVDLALQPEWHVYARDVGGGQPVSLTLADGGDFVATGALQLPPDHDGKLTGRVSLRLPLAARSAGGSLAAELAFQVCDALECLPPIAVGIAGKDLVMPTASEPFAVLLVVDVVDERSARIEAFLRERGFAVDVTTYERATADDCERHAVVVADSKLFGKYAKVLQHVRAFPKSSTPIVAVGFFGTELIEAHGLAMTSGYI